MMDNGVKPKRNSVSILLLCRAEMAGGNPVQSLELNHFGMLIGGFTDRYGYHWVIQCKGGTGRRRPTGASRVV